MTQPTIITLENIRKKYPRADRYSVDGISMQIPQQSIYGILGPNGAGKTTLLSILSGLLQPSAGKFTIYQDGAPLSPKHIKKSIGIVPQEYALYPTLTARENLRFFGALYSIPRKKLDHLINLNLEKLGLKDFADRKVEHFSGGMKRRCNLIAGMLHDPKILFLDEPTVGVDVQSRAAILQFLQEIRESGTTILYTSHHLHEAEQLCDRIAVMDNGRLYGSGTAEELMKQTSTQNLEDAFIALTGKNMRDAV